MDIDGIETFLAIAEVGSFTRAARRLHRSQPAISRRLEIVEHELGAPLFERLRGRARMTEAGRTFLPHAEAALAALRDGCEAVRGLQAGIGNEKLLVVAAPGHRLSGRHVRHAHLLAGERWIGFPSTPGDRDPGQALARQLSRAGLGDADVTLIDSLTAQKRLAQAGFGLALVPESSVRDELRQGVLVALDIPCMQTTIPITAVHRRNGYLSAVAKALLGLLTTERTRPDGVGSARRIA